MNDIFEFFCLYGLRIMRYIRTKWRLEGNAKYYLPLIVCNRLPPIS